MQLRPSSRKLVTAVAAILLAAPVLSSCGFNYATDRVYTPANGINNRDASVDVLNAVVVSGQEGSGTFIASFANNDHENEATVDSLEATAGDKSLQVQDFQPIKVPPARLVNLATEGGVVLTGDFGPGNFVTVTIGFDNGEQVEVDVPTVDDCGEYSGLDTSAQSPSSGSASASQSPSESSSESPSESVSGSPSESASESPSESASAGGSEASSTGSSQCGATGAPAEE